MPISEEANTHYIPGSTDGFKQHPNSTGKSITSDPSMNDNAQSSTPQTVNVDLAAGRTFVTRKTVGPLIVFAIGVLLVGGFATAIAIPVVLSQHKATGSITTSVSNSVKWNTTTTTATTSSSLTTSTTSTTTTTSTSSTITSSTSASSTSTTTTLTGTTARPIVFITRPGDPIIGVYNTTAGGNIGGVNGSFSSSSEYPLYGIDNNTATKYLNFGASSNGLNTGYYVTPAVSAASIALGLLFATANDAFERDPITVSLEGTNVTTIAALNQGSSWTLIYNGPTGISSATDPGRSTFVVQQNFTNSLPFRSYRLLVTSQRNSGTANCVQFSEGLILGYV